MTEGDIYILGKGSNSFEIQNGIPKIKFEPKVFCMKEVSSKTNQ